jgi:hypothetical protein
MILHLRSSDLLLQLCFVSCSSSWIDHYYRKLSDCVFFRASLILELLEIINGKIPIAETKAQKGRPMIRVIARIIGRLVCSSQNTAMNPRPFQYVWCSNVNNKYKSLFRRSTWNLEPYYSYRTDVPYVCRYILIGTMQSKPDRHLRLLSCYNDEINPRIFWHLLWCWWLFLANLKMRNFSAVSGSGFRWRRYYLEPVPVSCSCCIYLF